MGSESLWQKFAALLEFDTADRRWASNGTRVAHRDELIAEIELAFRGRSTDELLAVLDEAGIPAGRVRSIDEVYTWDQTRSQGLLIDVEHSLLGTVTLPGPPLRFFDAAGAENTRTEHGAPPLLGEHNDSVREWLAQ